MLRKKGKSFIVKSALYSAGLHTFLLFLGMVSVSTPKKEGNLLMDVEIVGETSLNNLTENAPSNFIDTPPPPEQNNEPATENLNSVEEKIIPEIEKETQIAEKEEPIKNNDQSAENNNEKDAPPKIEEKIDAVQEKQMEERNVDEDKNVPEETEKGSQTAEEEPLEKNDQIAKKNIEEEAVPKVEKKPDEKPIQEKPKKTEKKKKAKKRDKKALLDVIEKAEKEKKKKERRKKIQDLAEKENKKKKDSDFEKMLDDSDKNFAKGNNRNSSSNSKGGRKSNGGGASGMGAGVAAGDYEMISSQIYPYWVVPSGVRDAENIIIEIHIELGDNGEVIPSSIKIMDKDRYSTDQIFRAAADSARRAILQASPLSIPKEKLPLFKEFTLRFNLKEALGE